jgi:hypothetical protein
MLRFSAVTSILALLVLCILLAPLLALRQVALAQPPVRFANAKSPLSPTATRGQPLDVPAAVATVVAASSVYLPKADSVIDAKLLVLAADGAESSLSAITQTLDYLGTPYTVWIATQHPGGLTEDQLFSGNHSRYQGVMLTSDSLSFTPDGGKTWTSAFTDREWETLWRYEAIFGLRQAIWHAAPTVDFGFGPSTEIDTTNSPIRPP